MTNRPDALQTELVQAIRRSDAILYVVVRPAPDGLPGELAIDWGAHGITHRDGAVLIRDLAKQWDAIADAAGEPPTEVELIAMTDPTETTEDFHS